jgi:hypothetical protein
LNINPDVNYEMGHFYVGFDGNVVLSSIQKDGFFLGTFLDFNVYILPTDTKRNLSIGLRRTENGLQALNTDETTGEMNWERIDMRENGEIVKTSEQFNGFDDSSDIIGFHLDNYRFVFTDSSGKVGFGECLGIIGEIVEMPHQVKYILNQMSNYSSLTLFGICYEEYDGYDENSVII